MLLQSNKGIHHTALYELYICVDGDVRGRFHLKLLHHRTKFYQNSTEDFGVIVTKLLKGKKITPILFPSFLET